MLSISGLIEKTHKPKLLMFSIGESIANGGTGMVNYGPFKDTQEMNEYLEKNDLEGEWIRIMTLSK